MAPRVTTPTNSTQNLNISRLTSARPHISLGESDRPTCAPKVLTGQTPVTSKTSYTVRAFGIRRNKNIAVHVTIRRSKAEEILERGLKVQEYGLRRNFSETGNLGSACRSISTSARDTIRVLVSSGWTYMIMGRPGARKARIGFGHRVTKGDVTQAWLRQRFDGINQCHPEMIVSRRCLPFL
ncbi:hypothetical protein FIBSPDRAFT_920641 [Athelia psychrophila]|uniref:Ribosomal protein L5 n=1 Tax=Athelia psychrophila TaxID=1759441 RepID=A0A166G4B9_9AGAM|nr:hypothetical protein FIBSPDRAFT_920641 [Fibularhizoctonia sp. CBS 109695]